MKSIRSNKKGFRIHSPFTYNLVANVLFKKVDDSVSESIGKLKLRSSEKRTYKIIFNLLKSFNPTQVLFYGIEDKNTIDLFKKEIPDTNFLIDQNETELKAFLEKTSFVIFNEKPLKTEKLIVPKNKSVWCLKNCHKNVEMNDFFQTLLNHENIQLTIQFKKIGIIIVDDKIPKQNYVIK